MNAVEYLHLQNRLQVNAEYLPPIPLVQTSANLILW